MKTYPLFIQTKIKCELETLRTHRQKPSAHHQWNLRFPEIKYVSKDCGESTSVLKFSSISNLSVIKQGSGYWKYVSEKLHEAGYIFKCPTLETAFKNSLNNEQ